VIESTSKETENLISKLNDKIITLEGSILKKLQEEKLERKIDFDDIKVT
jgi:hypothetical protein